MRRGGVAVAVALLLLAAAGARLAWHGGAADPAAAVTVTWDETEGHPACVYDADNHVVDVRLRVSGTAPRAKALTVTVTAYADENTSKPVGSSSRKVPVEGTVDQSLTLTITVVKAPHVDEDGVAACRLDVA